MDSLTKQLFPNIPREIAFPWRKTVYSYREFKNEVINKNGITDIYTSVYGTNFLINKIFFDLDYGPDVLADAKAIHRFCLDNNYQSVPIVSGKKGYHIYIIVKPQIHRDKSKIRLLRAQYSIIKSVFGEFKRQMHNFPDGRDRSIFRNKDTIIAPDPQVCGDVKRISRVPNTLRPPENLNYCTYLDPDKFLDMTKSDVIIHMKSPHNYKYKIDYRDAPALTDFTYEFDEPPNFTNWSKIEGAGISIPSSNPSKYLKDILRPCVYRHIATIHPSDEIRFCTTLDLVSLGLSPESITGLYSTLGWEDFDERTTLKKVITIKSKFDNGTYKPWSCRKLIAKRIPRLCCVE